MKLAHGSGGIRAAVAAVVLATVTTLLPATPASAQPTSFTFSAAGDLGANSNTTASLDALAASGSDYFVALGDLSYDEITPESAWCTYVKSHLPANYPFELLAGNHEDNGSDGLISNFRQCLPNQLGGAIGDYAKEYYLDYPPAAPLARTILISPDLTFPGESEYSYATGTSHRNWLTNAIDSARASGIPWVIVGMHKNCISAGVKSCEIGTDLFNFLVQKKST